MLQPESPRTQRALTPGGALPVRSVGPLVPAVGLLALRIEGGSPRSFVNEGPSSRTATASTADLAFVQGRMSPRSGGPRLRHQYRTRVRSTSPLLRRGRERHPRRPELFHSLRNRNVHHVCEGVLLGTARGHTLRQPNHFFEHLWHGTLHEALLVTILRKTPWKP